MIAIVIVRINICISRYLWQHLTTRRISWNTWKSGGIGKVREMLGLGMLLPHREDRKSLCWRELFLWAFMLGVFDEKTTVWVKKSPPPEIFWHCFFLNGWEFLVQILHAYYTFLPTLVYKFLFNYLQLWQSFAILSATTIMCSKSPPSTETHAGWSHLIWHNFVTVADN